MFPFSLFFIYLSNLLPVSRTTLICFNHWQMSICIDSTLNVVLISGWSDDCRDIQDHFWYWFNNNILFPIVNWAVVNPFILIPKWHHYMLTAASSCYCGLFSSGCFNRFMDIETITDKNRITIVVFHLYLFPSPFSFPKGNSHRVIKIIEQWRDVVYKELKSWDLFKV